MTPYCLATHLSRGCLEVPPRRCLVVPPGGCPGELAGGCPGVPAGGCPGVPPGRVEVDVVCVCVCVTSSRWRRGGHAVAGEQQFRGDSARKWRVCSWWVELYAYKAHLEPAMQLPVGSGRRFCRGCVSVSIEAQQLLRSVGLHLPTPTFHHTPWGFLSWLLDRTAITANSGYGVPCGLPGVPWRPFLRPRCPAATHPRAVWRGPGQPAHLTVCRPQKQDPGYRLGPALRSSGQGDQKKKKCVCVCVCVCGCVGVCVCVCVCVCDNSI